MKRLIASVKRAGGVSLAALVLAAATPAAALAYWDYQGILHDAPTPPYQAGETNPYVPWNWGHRISRSNCQAKLFLRIRGGGQDPSYESITIPGGCSTNDYKHCYNALWYDASITWNTDTGPGDVWVNVRVDEDLDGELC
jgi:hypothetical protein